VLILTHDVKGKPWLPHLPQLEASHPEAAVLVVSDASNDRRRAWRNGDRKLREWWRRHGAGVAGEVVTVLEWDVLVTGRLPSLPAGVDVAAKAVITRASEPEWPWFGESDRLGGLVPVGLAPLGVMVMRRGVLDELADPRWAALFARDIFCELRTGSIAATRFVAGRLDLPGVRWHPVVPGRRPGVYHAVKEAVG
jgi:hypothetical protein